MTKQLAARTVVITAGLVLVAFITAGAYSDGGWILVAATWITVVLVGILIRGLVWGLENWRS